MIKRNKGKTLHVEATFTIVNMRHVRCPHLFLQKKSVCRFHDTSSSARVKLVLALRFLQCFVLMQVFKALRTVCGVVVSAY